MLFFACLSTPLWSLTVTDVFYSDQDETADSSPIRNAVLAGIKDFSTRYPALAARGWLRDAELSVASSSVIEDGQPRHYLRLDLAHDSEEESFRFDVDPLHISPRDFASALRNLVYAVDGFAKVAPPAPVPVRRFSVDAFAPTSGSPGAITGLATLPDSRLAVAQSNRILLLDSWLKLTSRLVPVGIDQPLGSIASSPSGTLLSLLPSSDEIVVFYPPETTGRRLSTGSGVAPASAAWLSDGTLAFKSPGTPQVSLLDAQAQTDVRLSEFTLEEETCYLSAGPETTFFSFHPRQKSVAWNDREGKPLARFIPCLPEALFSQVRSLKWLGDGSFLVRGTGFTCRWNREGELLWLLPLDPSLGKVILDATFDEREGILSLVVPGNRNIIQYRDRSLPPLPGTSPYSASVGADQYLASGASDYALYLYQALARKSPGDQALGRIVADLKVRRILAEANELEAKVRQTIASLGPESARVDYSAVMSRYEQALALRPGDGAILEARGELAKTMKDAELGVQPVNKPLTLDVQNLRPIFPALATSYRDSPVAQMTVRNETGRAVRNLRASLFIPRFMDFPTEAADIPVLEAGAVVQVNLTASFNQEALAVEEDLPIQAMVKVSWTADGTPVDLDRSLSGLVHRRTALTWDDAGKLASFVTPNEGTVNRFALGLSDIASRSLGSEKGPSVSAFSPRIARVSAILEGMANYRLHYLEDPQSPLSRVMGGSETVDTVRFPRTTLLFHGGDCDDLTALLLSLLEAAGIPTAIVTSPGHVFLAFDTGLTVDRRWILDPFGTLLVRDGNLWMPLESTIWEKGLIGSWATAGKLVNQWQETEDFSFLPVGGLRGRYPSVSLPPTAVSLSLPEEGPLSLSLQQGEARILEQWYRSGLAGLSVPLSNSEDEAKRLNRRGIFQAVFGDRSAAATDFASVLKVKPDSFSAIVNLANLAILDGREKEVQTLLAKARELRPGSPVLAEMEKKVAGPPLAATKELRGSLAGGVVNWLE